jgi:hypothetical protein
MLMYEYYMLSRGCVHFARLSIIGTDFFSDMSAEQYILLALGP